MCDPRDTLTTAPKALLAPHALFIIVGRQVSNDEEAIMERSNFWSLAVGLLAIGLVGCATNRSEIKLASPVTAVPAAKAGAAAEAKPEAATSGVPTRTIVLRSVTDERSFEERPSDPSHPSLGFEGSSGATAETRARAIGRKRNTFGQALGDVLLENGQTVTGVMSDSITASLTQAGYRVVTDPAAAAPGDPVLDVHIKGFWSWFQPGFWAIKLHADIVTQIDVNPGTPFTVEVHAQDSRQAATEKAWMQAIEKGLAEYRAQLADKVAALH
jgi:hypothetical protein